MLNTNEMENCEKESERDGKDPIKIEDGNRNPWVYLGSDLIQM